MANEPTAKKRPNCVDGTCPPARAVHAKGCGRRAAFTKAEEVILVPETRPQTGWRTDTKEEFEQRLKLAREMQNEIQAEKRPWWKKILRRGGGQK